MLQCRRGLFLGTFVKGKGMSRSGYSVNQLESLIAEAQRSKDLAAEAKYLYYLSQEIPSVSPYRAIEALQRSADLLTQLGDHKGAGLKYRNMAVIYNMFLDDPDRALATALRGMDIAMRISDAQLKLFLNEEIGFAKRAIEAKRR
jgi:hypothetical protein